MNGSRHDIDSMCDKSYMIEKQCKKCQKMLPVSEYGKDKKSKDRLKYTCRSCENEKTKLWARQNKEKRAQIFRNWYTAQRPDRTLTEIREQQRQALAEQGLKECAGCKKVKGFNDFYTDNRAKDKLTTSCKMCCRDRSVRWEAKSQDKVRAKSKRWKYRRPENLIHARMSNAIYGCLKRGTKQSSWLTLVDYTISDLRAHLEEQFTEGMTWDLFMKGEIHIDHIRPKSWFIFDSPNDEEFKKCWALSNLQPMWGPENCSKNNKYEGKYKSVNKTVPNDQQTDTPLDKKRVG